LSIYTHRSLAVDYGQFAIWCDKDSDVELVQRFAQVFPDFLGRVTHIHVLPTLDDRLRAAHPRLAAVMEYDRPDLIVTYCGEPILVVEITLHGYTGDNPLQRFARLLRAAELGVPVIYATPFARARIDESLATDRRTSQRRVSSRVFEGFARLMDLFSVPVVAVDWAVNERGLPRPVETQRDLEEVCGPLVRLIEHVCAYHANDVLGRRDFRACNVVGAFITETRNHAAQRNVLKSETRLEARTFDDMLNVIHRPSSLPALMGEDYFWKGKDEKLMARLCLTEGAIKRIETTEGRIARLPSSQRRTQSLLPKEFADKPWLILYSGYEWRGEPNAGIVANADVTLCRTGSTPKDRSQFLAVVWPRVFWDGDSTLRKELLNDLERTCDGSRRTKLARLLSEKRKRRESGGSGESLRYAPKKIGVWRETATVARIYRSLCDLVILNDAVLLGDHWKGVSGE
jgi:hypothetical protein